MTDEQTTREPGPGRAEVFAASEPETHQPLDAREQWPEDAEELPRRPRRRLLTPAPLALLAVLAIACGFIAGVLVEKHQGAGSGGTSGASLASRFAALRGAATVPGAAGSGAAGSGAAGAAGSGTNGVAGTAGATSSSPRAAAGGRSGVFGGGATAGQVAYVNGSTLYVTTAEGNTVKVTTSASSSVTKSVKSSVKRIHPGETVVVTGAAAASGAISAESIRVGSSGLGALFGGARAGGTSGGGSAKAGGGEQALFGSGG